MNKIYRVASKRIITFLNVGMRRLVNKVMDALTLQQKRTLSLGVLFFALALLFGSTLFAVRGQVQRGLGLTDTDDGEMTAGPVPTDTVGVWESYASPTPIPTSTPYPTYTPYPTPTQVYLPTATPWPTATAWQPTATPWQPTATAVAQAPSGSGSSGIVSAPRGCLSPDEADLARQLNRYRNMYGLASIPVTRSLTDVAQWHVIDLHHNQADTCSPYGWQPSNMHSWSGRGHWGSVCYTPDHAYAAQMWSKPREITRNLYQGNGFEIAYFDSRGPSPTDTLVSWQRSPGHNTVIVQGGTWANFKFGAMGVGIMGEYAVVWFGDQPDPQGGISLCP